MAAYYPLPALAANSEHRDIFDVRCEVVTTGIWNDEVPRCLLPYGYTAAYYALPPKEPVRQPVHLRAALPRKPRDYKDDLFTLPAPLDKPITHYPAMEYRREAKMEAEHLDHPSWRRPPYRRSVSDTKRATPPLPVEEEIVDAFITPPESPVDQPDANLLKTVDLIPTGPMDPPDALPLWASGYMLVDATAAVLHDRFSSRFGTIGMPKPSDVHHRKPSAEAMDAMAANIKRGDFSQFARRVLSATSVSPGTVIVAVSYLKDERLRKELNVRSLELSFVGALSIANKLTSDNAYNTTMWSNVAGCSFDDLKFAERAILYALDFDVQLKSDLLVDAARTLLDRIATDAPGRLVLIQQLDTFLM